MPLKLSEPYFCNRSSSSAVRSCRTFRGGLSFRPPCYQLVTRTVSDTGQAPTIAVRFRPGIYAHIERKAGSSGRRKSDIVREQAIAGRITDGLKQQRKKYACLVGLNHDPWYNGRRQRPYLKSSRRSAISAELGARNNLKEDSP
jgi:hypothetical protein